MGASAIHGMFGAALLHIVTWKWKQYFTVKYQFQNLVEEEDFFLKEETSLRKEETSQPSANLFHNEEANLVRKEETNENSTKEQEGLTEDGNKEESFVESKKDNMP